MGEPRPVDHGGQVVTIGLRDIYDQVQQVSTGYTSLVAKLDAALISQGLHQQTITQQFGEIHRDIQDHEHRLRALEARPNITPKAAWGAAGIIIAGLSLVLTIIALIISK